MFFILSKVLAFLTMPLSWAIILMISGLIWTRIRFRMFVIALIVLALFSNGVILNEVNRLWELPLTDESEIEAEIGVVLGGYAYFDTVNHRLSFYNTTDRVMQGLRLLQTGRIQKLLLCGGSGYVTDTTQLESLYVRDFLLELGIDSGRILVETRSRNTHENALYAKELLDLSGIVSKPVLITSAYHMRRSVACFARLGVDVLPYPANPLGGPRRYTLDQWLVPNSFVLAHWCVVFHEWLGFIVYKISGRA